MFERDVTMRASTPARADAARTASCLRLSAALGACDMDGGQELFERGDRGEGRRALDIDNRDHRNDRWRRRMNQEFLRGLLEGEALDGVGGRLGFNLPRQIGNRLLEVGVVARDGERRAVLLERVYQRSLTVKYVGEPADGGEVFGRALQHLLQFALRVAELLQFDERTPHRHPR